MLKKSVAILLFGILVAKPSQLSAQTPQCGGSGGSAYILPSSSNVKLLVLYAYFPSGGEPGTDTIPSFANTAAQHQEDYYDEMSYNTHHLSVDVFDPNNGDAFETDNALSYYGGGAFSSEITELNTEILDKAYAEDNSVFNNVDAVFIFYGGNVYNPNGSGTGVAVLSHNSSHYSGCGALIEWGYWDSNEEIIHKWQMAHEYGHLLSPDGTSGKRLLDQVSQPGGIYNIMHNVYFNGTQPLAAFNLIHLGWIESSWIKEIDPTQSGDQSQSVTIKDTRVAPSGGNYNVARIQIPGTTNEHFLIENRQGTGSDSSLSENGEGLIIWHLDKAESQYDNDGNMDVEIATAIDDHGEDWLDDGVQLGSENRGFTTDFFNDSNNSLFAPWTNPSTETGYLYSGSHSFTDIALVEIEDSGTTMSFDFLENAPPGSPQNLTITNPNEDGENVELAWDANTEPDLDDYAIYRGYQDDGSSPVNWNSSPSATTSNTSWTDPFVEINRSASSSVHYRITASDDAGNESDYSNSVSTKSYQVPKPSAPELPEEIALHHNYPNPFNPHTQIRFDLSERTHVTLKIYNLLGEEVRTLVDGVQEIGEHSVTWDGLDGRGHEVPSGVYLYRMQVETASENTLAFSRFGKMTLLR